jgi:oligoendopeptidase F
MPVTWDLSPLYASPDDPRIDEDLAAADRAAAALDARWRGRVAALDPATLATAVAEYEAIDERGRRPSFYASLLFAADTTDERARRLLERTRERWVAVANAVTFFELEVKALPAADWARLAVHPALGDVRHWAETLRRRAPHTLSEPEERIVNQKNLTGREALVRLFDEVSSSFRFRVEVGGTERDLTGEETLALLQHPDAAVRERAYRTFLETFAGQEVVLTGVFNAILQDHRLDCELRRYPDPVAPTHLDNEVRAETVETMMAATERRYPLAQEYFRLKARLLGLPRLKNTDLYAPLGAAPATIPFADAQALVLDSFAAFSPAFADRARAFFERRWIDAEVRPGKRLGAFCASPGPYGNPWILLSYTGTPRDVATLAHELGHGIHDCLAARQRALNYEPPLTLAETASTFCEMVLMRGLLAREPRPAVRREILCAKIEDTIATVFRQNVLTRFEMAAHARRRDELLGADALCDLWWAENAKLYGDAVEMIPAYRWGWSYIPHFVHSRFYCYAYVFGELLVLALWQRWVEEGAAFLPRYEALLAAGGSDAPAALLRPLGVDLDDPAFWDRGFRALEGLVAELRATLA